MISEITNILHYFCLSNLIFLIGLFAWRYHYDLRIRIAAGFSFGIICYIILSLDPNMLIPLPIRVGLFGGLLSLPFFFWILSSAIFVDNFHPKLWHWSILVGKILISALLVYPVLDEINMRGPIESETVLAHIIVPTLLSLAFVLAAILQTYSGRKDDLIETRRRLREVHILVTGSVITFSIFSHLILRGKALSEILDLLNVVLAWGLILAFMHLVLELKDGLVDPEPDGEIEEEERVIQADPALKRKLVLAFEEEKLYRKEGLTIGQLAEDLEVQEYKLRRLINQAMGFRNFPDFLNRYRIQEACEILLDSGKDEFPIIRIAMDLGYQSLGPFNRAFKELTGVTPTEFRKNRERQPQV
ncbi:DNA-binding helix-turn-helix protein [Leptospira inadai serovar Lyme str. 10]|uniref:DNA-binding helix-turn-helix protein n=2 Tax=Leptospira inadai serovar Lyme TaxID=293084 RepID=V6HFU3_9LEPT|nr:helix-turn-helix transcriptional regulator [Leptospira inadai]EQA38763.1 DNA-binding helix-turn-helix protein [Leptospira inadai serovar Lyme str. 10]PNV75225.1 AraC family transcriptional regulator [Leptospira inadai serovar Lyme]